MITEPGTDAVDLFRVKLTTELRARIGTLNGVQMAEVRSAPGMPSTYGQLPGDNGYLKASVTDEWIGSEPDILGCQPL
ncbi:hypothetical protein CYMTET_53138 [Cymbomonas tetramitiformis]|uniref:Uncharacterized protein n=1 Tax=Cymbomonas tetramitiformis TaxID=36881 RepID=A0AAE0EQN1_9CHLO|nr:hypothetical protein CYMTET_53138 [Cymbomonas tetramitiformis]